MNHTLVFDEKNIYKIESLPANADEKIIYVFRDTINSSTPGFWNIKKILYIGISLKAEERLNSSHNKIQEAKKMLADGHFLTFTYHKFNGNTTETTIRAIENALIYANKPPLNDQNKDVYHSEKYGNIEIFCTGKRASLLKQHIILPEEDKK